MACLRSVRSVIAAIVPAARSSRQRGVPLLMRTCATLPCRPHQARLISGGLALPPRARASASPATLTRDSRKAVCIAEGCSIDARRVDCHAIGPLGIPCVRLNDNDTELAYVGQPNRLQSLCHGYIIPFLHILFLNRSIHQVKNLRIYLNLEPFFEQLPISFCRPPLFYRHPTPKFPLEYQVIFFPDIVHGPVAAVSFRDNEFSQSTKGCFGFMTTAVLFMLCIVHTSLTTSLTHPTESLLRSTRTAFPWISTIE